MITKALLFDLLGPKVLAIRSFTKDRLSDDFHLAIVDKYSELMSELAGKPAAAIIADSLVYFFRVNEATLVIAISDSPNPNDEEMEQVKTLGIEMSDLVSRIPVRDAKNMFLPLVEKKLRKKIYLGFVCESNPPAHNHSGRAVLSLVQKLSLENQPFTRAAKIGPFDVHLTQMTLEDLEKSDWSEPLNQVDSFAIIISTPIPRPETIGEAIRKIRANTTGNLLIIPGSDSELEMARELESSYFLELCDSVSSRPSDLVLSVLATAGFVDMHPELARKKWTIDSSIDEAQGEEVKRRKPIGHQAFFVIDKISAEPRFTYIYDEDSTFMATAPNVVAAISQFQLDQASPTSTSVFQAGGLKYAIIERGDILFTLITGDKEDVEVIRERFSFLPDLYLDESPENKESSEDLYTSPPFTLKLLATLPPEELPGRVAPKRILEPEWDRFDSELVTDFLQAVWSSLDGNITISDLSRSTGGPDMVMGAIHLLKRIGAIEWGVRVDPDDIPILTGSIGDDIRALYTHVDAIIQQVDGRKTIEMIGNELGFEPSILLTVFAELHRRGNVSFKES